jgi:hypothetical protein
MQVGGALQMLFELPGSLGDETGPGLHQDVAQLKAARTIDIVLKIILAELEPLGEGALYLVFYHSFDSQ